MRLEKEKFQIDIDGQMTDLYTLETNSIICQVTNYGARIVSFLLEDSDGVGRDLVQGFSSINGYLLAEEQYHGAFIGRYANRISNGRFMIDGDEYFLDNNNGNNSLHGGIEGFHRKVWSVKYHDATKVVMGHVSVDMEEGFPGELDVEVTYEVKGTDLIIEYKASTNKDTVLNLTNHCYWNLNGVGSGDILNHNLTINAENYTPCDASQVPNGKLDLVHDSPFDFINSKIIGKDINEDHEQLKYGNGYDHNFVVNQWDKNNLNYVATVEGDMTQIAMEVWSKEPGVQFFTANHFSGNDIGKSGQDYGARSSFCLETQHFPDSPNIGHFPSTRLNAGDQYLSSTEYRFSFQ